MSSCKRFEEEGLEAEVLSEALAEHLKSCVECRKAQAGYNSLCQLLGQCEAPLAMPCEWKEKVWRALESPEGEQKRPPVSSPVQPVPSLWERMCMGMRPYRWFLGGVVTAALVGVLVFSTDTQRGFSTTVSSTSMASLEWHVVDASASRIRTADKTKLGSRIHITAQVPLGLEAALFVYVQNRRVFSCSPTTLGAHCEKVGEVLKAQVPLEQLGLYRALWVVSAKPLPVSEESFDVDAAAFLRAGANIQHPFAIEVY